MNLETAAVVPGSETPAGDGARGANRCVLALRDGTRRAAYVKRMKSDAVLAEAFCALLLDGWGVTIPQPFLVHEAAGIAFASADAGYPSLKQRFNIGNLPEGPAKNALILVAASVIAEFSQTPMVIMADEAIDNRDRNLGNVLWDGQETAWIDHELTLGLAAHRPDTNKLAQLVQLSSADHEATKQSAIAAWMAANRDLPRQAGEMTNSAGYAEIVAARLNGLGTRILTRFPAPEDLLSGR